MPIISDAATTLANPVVATAAPGPEPQPSEIPNQIPPVAAQPVPSSLQPQQSQTQQVPSHLIKDSVIGKGVKALANLVHGRETQYAVDPNTGQMVETSAPAKPGAIFRNILMGALIGGAVGSQGGGRNNGFVQGFARGGAAGMEAQQAQDAQKRQYARQTFQDQLAAQREKREQATVMSEDQVRQATVAHLTAQTAIAYQNMAAQNEERLQQKNVAARTMMQQLEDAGGVRAQISINGTPQETMTALELAQEYTKNPSIRQGPNGTTRVFLDTHDLSRLTWDGQVWRTDSGNVADMSEHSQVVAYDVPNATLKSHRQVGGDVINKLAGANIADPKKMYDTTGDALLGLYTVGLKDKNTAAQADAREARAKSAEENKKKFTQIENTKNAQIAKAQHKYFTATNATNGGKVTDDEALKTLNFERQQAQDLYEQEIQNAGGTVQHLTYAPDAKPGDQPIAQSAKTPAKTPQTFSPSKWKAAHPNGDVNAAIAQAKSQGIPVIQ